MIKGRDALGLPVINVITGECVGNLKDICINQQCLCIDYFVIIAKNELGKIKCRPDQVKSFGRDAIIIDCPLTSVENTEECFNIQKLKGCKVICNQGNELGLIVDILFEPDGQIVGFELSQGIINDIVTGRQLISKEAVCTYGEDCIIVAF